MGSRVISDLRIWPILLWLGITIGAACVEIEQEVVSDGLRRTMYFHAIGYGIYLVFYGAIFYMVTAFTLMLGRRKGYLSSDGENLFVGTQQFNMFNMHVEARRNWAGVRELSFTFAGGQRFAVRAYTLARPLPDLLAELNELIAQDSKERSKGS